MLQNGTLFANEKDLLAVRFRVRCSIGFFLSAQSFAQIKRTSCKFTKRFFILKDLFLSSSFLKGLSESRKVAFIALFTALSVVCNTLLEIRVFDVQFSLTITFSFLCGIFLGPVFGFTACILGDLTGYLINSFGQLYMPWVGVSTGCFAFLAGIIFTKKSQNYLALNLKATIFAVASFIVCTVLINSTGFYFYNRKIGFSDALFNYVEIKTGNTNVSFLLYLGYRLIFKGQIFNSIANYVLIFILIPIIKKIPATKNVL